MKKETKRENKTMNSKYMNQINITLNNGVGGRRKDMLKRRIIEAIQGYMDDCSMYNDLARKTIKLDIDIKISFREVI